jgi:hypothetical protein
MEGTILSSDDDERMMEDESMAEGVDVLPEELRCWKVGVETPPFVSTNDAICQLLHDLAVGTVDTVPTIEVSQAVAVQIYLLIFDKKACSTLLKGIGWRGFYIILASLTLGTSTEPPTAIAIKLLQLLLTRPARSPGTGGLVIVFNHIAKERKSDPELKGLATIDEARRLLLLRWDRIPLGFDFGQSLTAEVAAGGGGGGGGGGGDDGTVEGEKDPRVSDAPLRHSSRPVDLDVRVKAFAAASVHAAFFSNATTLSVWHEVAGSRTSTRLYLSPTFPPTYDPPRTRSCGCLGGWRRGWIHELPSC